MGARILIIKLGALGDVVRTTCLLPTLKRLYPLSHITWVSRPNGVRILQAEPAIDQLVVFDAEGILALTQQKFDLVLSLDKDVSAAALCDSLQCPDKRGIGLSDWGTIQPLNAECESYFELGLDDHLKFDVNTKSYPQLIHEAVGFEYTRRPYRLHCDCATLAWARRMFEPWRAECAGPIIGLNTGAGNGFANKAPSVQRWIEVAASLVRSGFGVALLGNGGERAGHAVIAEQVGRGVYRTGNDNSEPQFVAIVSQCDVVVTGDTLAMHVALARNVPVVALFGPTCEQEIDLFGMGTKIVTPLDCAPCYKRVCDKSPNCMDSISAQQIIQAVADVLEDSRPCRTNHEVAVCDN